MKSEGKHNNIQIHLFKFQNNLTYGLSIFRVIMVYVTFILTKLQMISYF